MRKILGKMEKTLVDLNLDCLREVLKHCDLETLTHLAESCTLLRDIIRAEYFPKFKHFEFVCVCGRTEHSRNQMKQLRNIGQHLQSLEISIRCSLESIDCVPLFTCLKSCIGEQIRELIISSPTLPENLVRIIEPLLRHIESLKIFSGENALDFDHNIDYRSMCPNLLHLHMRGDATFIPNAKPWRRLESFTYGDNEYVANETLTTFYKNNPQLKNLRVSTFNADVQINEIVELLPNLERWVIYQNNSDLNVANVERLGKLTKLHDLKILCIDHDIFNGIVRGLGRCTQLKHLKIQAYYEGYEEELLEPNHHDIMTLVAELKQLETFDISSCQLNETFVMDFLKFAPIGFKELHLHSELKITDALIIDVAQYLQNERQGKDLEPLKICASHTDVQQLSSTVNDPDVRRYVQIFTCPFDYEDQRMFD